MNYLFCGGRFHFDYMKEGYLAQAEDDYRVSFLGDVRKLLRGKGSVPLSERLTYIGPFYFESDGMIDKEIVKMEMRQIRRCTHAIFLLEDGCCPGTVSEIVYAASHQKRISIFYIRDNKETESDKFNRVDILAEDEKGELMIFEIQNNRELDYFHRMAYGTSKVDSPES